MMFFYNEPHCIEKTPSQKWFSNFGQNHGCVNMEKHSLKQSGWKVTPPMYAQTEAKKNIMHISVKGKNIPE